MKIIITTIFYSFIGIVSSQDDMANRTSDEPYRLEEGLQELVSFVNLESLSSLENLSSLEDLSSLESLDELNKLAGLEALQAIEHINDGSPYNGNFDSSSEISRERKEHKIAMTNGQLILDGLDQVKITGYSGSEVIISKSVQRNNDHDERAKGLKVVNSLGLDDNTGLGLNATKSGNELTIIQVSQSCCDDDLEIKVPFGISLDISNNSVHAEDIDISDIKDEIVVSTSYSDVTLNEVTGPLAIKAVHGSIEAVMADVSSEGSISLYSVYDILDLTIPADTKSNIEISTPYGEILTNIDIDVASSSDMRKLSNKSIRGTINGGGLDISIKSGHDNVYLRKK